MNVIPGQEIGAQEENRGRPSLISLCACGGTGNFLPKYSRTHPIDESDLPSLYIDTRKQRLGTCEAFVNCEWASSSNT